MLKVDFLNVGKGNCTVILFPSGRLTVVDIDNSRIDDKEETLQCPIDFIRNNYREKDIFRFILTHPDMDHMSGLAELIKHKTIYNFWDTDHEKEVDADNMHLGGYDSADWKAYQKLRVSSSEPKAHKILRDESSDFWNQDNIEVLSPTKKLIDLAKDSEEHNHLSYVLKIQHRGISILLGGDATKDAWQDIYEHYGKDKLKADVFLAPHHGSPDNINEDVFQHIKPKYVIVSDHEGHKYDYAYYNKLASVRVCSTKHHGNISLSIGPEEQTIVSERNWTK